MENFPIHYLKVDFNNNYINFSSIQLKYDTFIGVEIIKIILYSLHVNSGPSSLTGESGHHFGQLSDLFS